VVQTEDKLWFLPSLSFSFGIFRKASPYLKGEVAALWLTVGVFDCLKIKEFLKFQ